MEGNYKKWLNRINAKLDKGGYIGNAQDLKDEIDEKINIPTMTNNYYGLWNDTTKEFINGTLREEADYLQSDLPVKIKGTPIVPKEEIESLFFGTYPQNVTSGQNTIFGYKNGKDLTTGYANLLIGLNASPTMTTGIGNITITGWGTGGYNSVTGNQELPITGKHNISIGTSANNGITSGSRNVAVGNGALSRIKTGSNNISIGYSAASALTTGDNNIVIGNYAGGVSATQAANQTMTNKLVIHNIVNATTGAGLVDRANSFWESVPSPNGTNTWDTSLITGDFYERWVKFQGKFIIGSSYMPVADTTYTKNIVAKPDGTFGWTDGLISDKVRFNLSKSIIPMPNTLVPKADGSGLVWYDNDSVPKDLGGSGGNAEKLDKFSKIENITVSQDTNYVYIKGDVLHVIKNGDMGSTTPGSAKVTLNGYLEITNGILIEKTDTTNNPGQNNGVGGFNFMPYDETIYYKGLYIGFYIRIDKSINPSPFWTNGNGVVCIMLTYADYVGSSKAIGAIRL